MPGLSRAPFRTMHGLHNRFVILDRRGETGDISADEAARLADPKTGPGCDQVITIETPIGAENARMGIWNADGEPAGACGNASRCVADILMKETGDDTVTISVGDRILRAARAENDLISVDMGVPKFDWEDIPLAEQTDDTRFVDVKLGPIDNPVLWGPSAVNVGNPHCVFFVNDVDAHALDRFGPLVENHPMFPDRVNVSLAQVIGSETIRLRVWERGAGITQACGTAACAALVTAHRRRLIGRSADVRLDGGVLNITWDDNDHIIMTGPYAYISEGVLPDDF